MKNFIIIFLIILINLKAYAANDLYCYEAKNANSYEQVLNFAREKNKGVGLFGGDGYQPLTIIKDLNDSIYSLNGNADKFYEIMQGISQDKESSEEYIKSHVNEIKEFAHNFDIEVAKKRLKMANKLHDTIQNDENLTLLGKKIFSRLAFGKMFDDKSSIDFAKGATILSYSIARFDKSLDVHESKKLILKNLDQAGVHEAVLLPMLDLFEAANLAGDRKLENIYYEGIRNLNPQIAEVLHKEFSYLDGRSDIKEMTNTSLSKILKNDFSHFQKHYTNEISVNSNETATTKVGNIPEYIYEISLPVFGNDFQSPSTGEHINYIDRKDTPNLGKVLADTKKNMIKTFKPQTIENKSMSGVLNQTVKLKTQDVAGNIVEDASGDNSETRTFSDYTLKKLQENVDKAWGNYQKAATKAVGATIASQFIPLDYISHKKNEYTEKITEGLGYVGNIFSPKAMSTLKKVAKYVALPAKVVTVMIDLKENVEKYDVPKKLKERQEAEYQLDNYKYKVKQYEKFKKDNPEEAKSKTIADFEDLPRREPTKISGHKPAENAPPKEEPNKTSYPPSFELDLERLENQEEVNKLKRRAMRKNKLNESQILCLDEKIENTDIPMVKEIKHPNICWPKVTPVESRINLDNKKYKDIGSNYLNN